MIRTPPRKNTRLPRSLLALLLMATLLPGAGCREETAQPPEVPEAAAPPAPGEQGMLSSALDAIKDGASRVQKAVEPYASPIQSTAVESVQKLLAIEYRVVEVGLEESADVIEMELQHLGTDRWDCSPMPATFNRARFLCKRYPMTSYLKVVSLLSQVTPD